MEGLGQTAGTLPAEKLQRLALGGGGESEIAGPATRTVDRIAGTADDLAGMTASIEKEKMGLFPRQPGGHMDLLPIGGKMHQRPLFEIEQRSLRITIFPVLSHRVPPALPGSGVFQLNGRHGQAVHRKHHVQRTVAAGIELAHTSSPSQPKSMFHKSAVAWMKFLKSVG